MITDLAQIRKIIKDTWGVSCELNDIIPFRFSVSTSNGVSWNTQNDLWDKSGKQKYVLHGDLTISPRVTAAAGLPSYAGVDAFCAKKLDTMNVVTDTVFSRAYVPNNDSTPLVLTDSLFTYIDTFQLDANMYINMSFNGFIIKIR